MPSSFADTTTANECALSETVRLDPPSCNPKWYEGMLASGYEGTGIQKRLNNTLGWSPPPVGQLGVRGCQRRVHEGSRDAEEA